MRRAVPDNIKVLLDKTKSLLDKQCEISRLKGELFNIFHILKIEGDEDGLHSRLIAALLDPEGSHNEGCRFLELFLGKVFPDGDRKIDPEKATVKTEHYIGGVRIDGREDPGGGRIDIFVTDGSRHISIENKVFSSEGDRQVERYCNYKPRENFVLYLTLFGEEAETEKDNYEPISYRDHIIPWLGSCQRHCTDRPIIRETIKQYIITLKRLMGGTTMDETKRELYGIMEENLETSHEIYVNYISFREEKIDSFVEDIKSQLEGEYPEHEIKIFETKRLKKKGLSIINKAWILQKKTNSLKSLPFQVRLEPEGSNYLYGIFAHKDDYDRPAIEPEFK